MALLLLLLLFCSRNHAMTLPQPSAVAAVVGSSVNLSCHMQLGAEPVSEKNLYWYMPGPQEDSEWFVYPYVGQGIPTQINQNSMRRANPKHGSDMSLTILDVRLVYTGTYVCHMSVRINSKKRGVSGNGTYLLVHEPLETHMNDTRLLCRTEVQEVAHVSLIWELEDGQTGNLTRQFLHNSYLISNEVLIGDTRCRGQKNVTAICSLQYKGSSLTNTSIEIPCTGPPGKGPLESPQPVVLYAPLLASSLVILLVVFLICCVRRKRKKRDEFLDLYTNL